MTERRAGKAGHEPSPPDKDALGRRLMSVAYLEGDFLLRSGRRSRYYLDKYLFETDPQVLSGIVAHLGDLIRERREEGASYERLAAPELGAVALAAGLSMELELPFVIVRKEQKSYGTSKEFEGTWAAGERLALVEDVVTSAGAALSAVERLREAGLVVEDLFCVVDREEGGREAVQAAGLGFHPLFTASQLGVKRI